ncbi:MAG: DUF3971 domain-containing protein [Rhizobiaceae bacterium]
MPSAADQEVPRASRAPRIPARSALRSGVFRTALKSILFVLALLAIVVLGLYGIGASGLGSERLRLEAEAALRKVAGPEIAASIGPTRITLSGTRFLALDIQDFKLSSAGRSQIEAGSVQFGIRLLPLLTGKLTLGRASISDARIHATAFSLGRSGDWTQRIRNEEGLIDPDLAGEALFQALHGALDLLERGSTRRIDLENTDIVLAETGRIRTLHIGEARLQDSRSGNLSLSMTGALDGRSISLDGSAVHDGDRITELAFDLNVAPSEPLQLNPDGMLSEDGSKSLMGAARIEIRGAEALNESPSRLAVQAEVDDSVIDLGKRGIMRGDVALAATLLVGANKVEIDKATILTGRSRIVATGAVGPEPTDAARTRAPTYRYEFVTEQAMLAPLDSPDAPTAFSARMAGRFDERTRILTADELAVRTGEGQMVGAASAEFARGKTPGLTLALSASDMPVAQAKQFWPWMAAGRAREWVIGNFFGGRVTESEITYRVAPGRLGDGVPLNGDEISGRFEVRDSRFDTTGKLPPIRDAMGVIEFRGNDVDISLSSGVAYLPSGNKVDISNGVLKFRDANLPPVIGDLDLDLKGEAVAIAELASLEPIDAMRRLDLDFKDFSGTASGHVSTKLPLQNETDFRELEWKVKLSVQNLGISKPFQGQKLSVADGTIDVDPRRAVLNLDGRLNDIPAKLELVERLRDDGPARVRNIRLTIDDAQRKKIAPGLDDLVAGKMVLDVDASRADGVQKVSGDLTSTTLSIPWVGWSKGVGIPAKLSFNMVGSGSNTTLSDFALTGKSFGVSGDVKLAGGGLASARFKRVQLNRDDNASVDITRRGNAYSVSVKGDSFDARSLIKLVLSESDSEGASSTAGSSISVKASLSRLLGFNDEAFSGVQLSYSGKSGGRASYSLSATTRNGGIVSLENINKEGQDAMRVRSADAGALVRFLDVYENMRGGQVDLSLRGTGGGVMRGQVNATGFQIVNESRLGSIVSTKPPGSDRSLNQVVRRDIDTTRVEFQRGFANIEKGKGYLKIDKGVLRGPMIGSTFQGTLYDGNGNIDMTGTFMPAYGLNRLFAELPIIGLILGNGRDRGLIGVTFKLEGKFAKPQLQINPLSVIAPGIFRSIFEFQ